MGREDWYRNKEWNDAIEAEFRDRLSRARDRGQYLSIQGSALTGSADQCLVLVGLGLIDEALVEFEDDRGFMKRTAYLEKVRALAKLGREAEILPVLRAAQQLGPSSDTANDFLHFVVTRKLREHYVEARRLATDAIVSEIIPSNIFEYNCKVAMIADELGDEEAARNHALWALDAFDERRSPFWRLPEFGLVQSVAVDRFLEIERIASTATEADREFRPDLSSSRVPFKVFQRRTDVSNAYRVDDLEDMESERRAAEEARRARTRERESEAAELNLEIKGVLPGIESYHELEYYPLRSIAVAYPILLRWVARIDGSHHVASISDFLVRARVAGAAHAIGLAFERLVTDVHPTNTRFIYDLISIARDLVRSKPTSSDLLRIARLGRTPMPARHHLIAALVSRKVKGSLDFVDELLDDRTFSEAAVLGLRIIRSFRLENKRERVIALTKSAQPKVRTAAEKTLEELDRVVS
jgi:hypothetical protein